MSMDIGKYTAQNFERKMNMGRHNHRKHIRSIEDRYDGDYIGLPELPRISRIIAVPLKTIYINVDADPEADEIYTAKSWCDPILQLIVRKS